MRKLAMLTTALFGLSLTAPVFAQPNQAGPQPGLPPGAGVGAQNVVPPPMSGRVTTTTGAAPGYTAPMASTPAPMMTPRRHRARRHATRHMRSTRHMAPAAAPAPAQ